MPASLHKMFHLFRMSIERSMLGLLVAVLTLACRSCEATVAKPSIADFQHRTWDAKDGVLADTWAIAQTADGWLWFGGPNGLTRFNGQTFERVDVVTKNDRLSNAIVVLYATPSGELMVGHRSGGISILGNAGFAHYDDELTRKAGTVFAFGEDADGATWAATAHGLLRFDKSSWKLVEGDWNYPGGYTNGMIVDARGTLWVAATKRILRLTRGSHRFEDVGSAASIAPEFIQSPDGRTWFVDDQGVHLMPNQGAPVAGGPSVNARTSYRALIDSRSNFWIWYQTELPGPPGAAVSDVASIGSVKTIMEDREGSIWMGDQNATIHRLRRPDIVRLADSPTMLGGTPHASFAVDNDGTVWIAMMLSQARSALDGLWKLDQGVLQRVQGNAITKPSSITSDPRGRVSASDREAIWTIENGRVAKRVDLPDAARGALVSGLTDDCSGGLWVVFRGVGLLRYDGSAWRANGDVTNLPPFTPTAQTCDSGGHLWLGYGDGHVARVDNQHAERFVEARGTQIGAVSAIHAGRHTLVAGDRGLALLRDGRFLALRAGFPAFEGVTSIIESPNGDVWLNGTHGLVRIRSADLDRTASASATTSVSDIATDLFDANDGYPMPAYSYVASQDRSLAQTKDGRIWLAAHGGIAWLDPSQLRERSAMPSVVIRSMRAGGHQWEPVSGTRLPEATRALEIDYAALTYVHPERLRFRYRLEGSDAGWVDADTRRQAFYTNLGPGAYRFLVNVMNENGVWSESTAALDFVIPPTFVQSRTFLALCIAAAIGLLSLAYRLRARQLAARQKTLLDERLDERERIARELHDTLLQETQALILSVHASAAAIPESDPQHRKLMEALHRANLVMSEGRDRIQDLRVATDTQIDLPAALSSAISAMAAESSAGIKLEVLGSPLVLKPAVQSEVYAIGREAVRNAFRHAQAGLIDVEIVYGTEDFRLRVRDDGLGIQTSKLNNGSGSTRWGLRGMHERAEKMNARLSVWTRPQSGTEIELIVPEALAYEHAPKSTRWFQHWGFGSAR